MLLALGFRADALREQKTSYRIEAVERGGAALPPVVEDRMPTFSFVEIEQRYPGLTTSEMTGIEVQSACACMVNKQCNPDK